MKTWRFLSWGCGVQSTTLGAMSALGELETVDAIITSDTGWERRRTYEIRDWYTEWFRMHGVQVEIVSAGDIREMGAAEHIHIPFWTSTGGPLKRQCTREFKIRPIRRRVREILGYHPWKAPHPRPGEVEMWLGISWDEWTRAKKSRVKYTVHRWPLLERRMTRSDCIKWLESRDLPVPPQSACVCCPYRKASEWIQLREEEPESWREAVEFDRSNRCNPLAERGGSTVDALYIYKHGGPLEDADLEFDAERERRGLQLALFVCTDQHCFV